MGEDDGNGLNTGFCDEKITLFQSKKCNGQGRCKSLIESDCLEILWLPENDAVSSEIADAKTIITAQYAWMHNKWLTFINEKIV